MKTQTKPTPLKIINKTEPPWKNIITIGESRTAALLIQDLSKTLPKS